MPNSTSKLEFNYKLSIKVPTLNNYTIRILTIKHALGFYPVSVVSSIHEYDTYDVEAGNDQEFDRALEAIFTTKEVRDIISSLLTHINSLSE